jgi:predicted neuraminidase
MKCGILAMAVLASVSPGVGAAAESGDMEALLKLPGVVSAEFIFDEAPFPQCHASTIANTPTGLVAAWFSGTRESDPDVGIWLSRHVGGKWTPPVEVANGIQYRKPDGTVHRHPCWNPVLFRPSKGPLLLFYKCGPEPSRWWGMLTTSTDGGATWSEPRRLPEGILGPVKNKPVELADGTIVCPSSTEHDGWRLHLETTRDLGKSWTRIGPLNDGVEKGAIQPSILFHHSERAGASPPPSKGAAPAGGGAAPARWQMLARDLPNPSSGIDAVTLADGRQLLVYNHRRRASEDAPSAGSRAILNVAVSDDGVSWQAALVLEDGAGEYSYPAVIQTADGLVHVTYTWNRRRIKHVVLDPARLRLAPIVAGKWPVAAEQD